MMFMHGKRVMLAGVITISLLAALSCRASPQTVEVPVTQEVRVIPVTQEVEVTRVVTVPQTVEVPVTQEVEVTREVPGPPEAEVTREVPVTRVVEITREMEVIKEVPVEYEVEVTREVPVTRVVETIREVEVTKIVTVPQPTQATITTATGAVVTPTALPTLSASAQIYGGEGGSVFASCWLQEGKTAFGIYHYGDGEFLASFQDTNRREIVLADASSGQFVSLILVASEDPGDFHPGPCLIEVKADGEWEIELRR